MVRQALTQLMDAGSQAALQGMMQHAEEVSRSRRERSKLQLHHRRELHDVAAVEGCCCKVSPNSKDHSVGGMFSIVHAVSVLWASYGVTLRRSDWLRV